MSSFDPKQIKKLIAEHKDVLLNNIEAAVESKLMSLEPSEALSLRLMWRGGATRRVIRPGASMEYARALVAFMRQKTFEGSKVDSAVTPVMLAVIEAEVIAFYSSQKVNDAILEGIIEELSTITDPQDIVRAEMQENVEWLRKEYTALTIDSSYSLSGMLIDTSIAQIQLFLASATGKAIVASIGKALATTSGKIALQKMLMVVVQKVMASAAIKAAIITIIKKVGVSVLIKTAVGKALVALLAAVGIAHVPLAWMILPIIAGFLAHEYFTFPKKLARKLPSEMRSAMSSRFGELNENIAVAATNAIFAALEKEITRVRTPLPST